MLYQMSCCPPEKQAFLNTVLKTSLGLSRNSLSGAGNDLLTLFFNVQQAINVYHGKIGLQSGHFPEGPEVKRFARFCFKKDLHVKMIEGVEFYIPVAAGSYQTQVHAIYRQDLYLQIIVQQTVFFKSEHTMRLKCK